MKREKMKMKTIRVSILSVLNIPEDWELVPPKFQGDIARVRVKGRLFEPAIQWFPTDEKEDSQPLYVLDETGTPYEVAEWLSDTLFDTYELEEETPSPRGESI